MLKINSEQMGAFRQAAIRRFEDEMVIHLYQFHPKHSDVLGEVGVRQVIRYGMDKAKAHGFTNRGPVRFYLELINMFGCDFDTDPQYPWAAKVLNNKRLPDQNIRADRLHNEMQNYVDKIVGINREYTKSALQQLSLINFANFKCDINTETEIVNALNFIYPRKCEYLQEPLLRNLIRQSGQLAKQQNCGTYAGWILFSGATFTLGHGFPHDPMYPWISATLANTAIDDPNKRVERLYSKLMTYLKHVLVNLEI